VQLFERRPHALTLTKAGQHLLPAVVKSFDGSNTRSTTSARGRTESAHAARADAAELCVQLAGAEPAGLPPLEH